MKSVKILVVCLVAILVFSTLAYAEIPRMINYQGKITTPQGALIDTTTSMVFSIYADSTGGTPLWTETQTSVKVEFGVFSVILGSVSPILDNVFAGGVRYLGVKVGTDSEMRPLKPIVSIGYAYNSDMLNGMHAGNNVGNVPVNNGVLNTNLNADLLDGFSSEAFISPSNPINQVARGVMYIPNAPPGTLFTGTFSPQIDPNKSVVVLNDPGKIFVVVSLTSSQITIRSYYDYATPSSIYVGYQIIEYK